MSEKNNNSSDSLLTGLLTILFVGLKLTGYIDWSWWWVLAPMWIPVAVTLLVVAMIWIWARL